MATAGKLKDHLVTCNICIRSPSTLSCQHPLCQGCRTRYIKTQTDAVKTRSVLCPTCRQLTPVPQSDRPVGERAGQKKQGLLVTGVMDAFVPKNSEIQRDGGRDETVIIDLTTSPVLNEVMDAKVDEWDICNLEHIVVMKMKDMKVTVVTDSFGKSVKSFYTKGEKQLSSELKLSDFPSSVSVLSKNKVAVSVPWSTQILTVGVSPDLELLSTITTKERYHGLAVLDQSTLVASSWSSSCGSSVDVLDMTGRVVRTISTHPSIQQPFKGPCYLHVTRQGNILVSDSSLGSVSCLTPTGQVVFTYKPTGDRALRYPRGIASTTAGDIVIADCFGHKVIHISESGQFIKDILTFQDGLKYPVSLCVDDDRLCVPTRHIGIHMFQFSSK